MLGHKRASLTDEKVVDSKRETEGLGEINHFRAEGTVVAKISGDQTTDSIITETPISKEAVLMTSNPCASLP